MDQRRGSDAHRGGASLYDSTIAGGSLFPPDGTLRQALDAALSSPSGLGVAVDDANQVAGGVRGRRRAGGPGSATQQRPTLEG